MNFAVIQVSSFFSVRRSLVRFGIGMFCRKIFEIRKKERKERKKGRKKERKETVIKGDFGLDNCGA